MKTLNTFAFIVIAFCQFQSTLSAQSVSTALSEPTSLFKYLQQREIVDITLETDFEKLKAERAKRAYQPANLTILGDEKEKLSIDFQVKTRGKFRARSCDIPPMKLKSKKKVLKEEGFNKFNELKLVIPCSEDPKFIQYIAKEFLAYKIYNCLTDKSFQVQLVNIRFQQSGKKRPMAPKLAFLIEDKEELRDRLNLTDYPDSLKLFPRDMDAKTYTLFQVFQYMVGNTDWIVPVRHNLDVFQDTSGNIYPVPFDFDFAGLVDSHYAIPNPKTTLQNVRDRQFLGNDKTAKDLNEVFEIFKTNKAEIYSYISNFQWLVKSERKKIIKYLDQFYAVIEDAALVDAQFISKPDFWKPQY